MLGTKRTVTALGIIVESGQGERRLRAVDALKALAADTSLCATIAKLEGVVPTVLDMTQRGDQVEADHALTLLKVLLSPTFVSPGRVVWFLRAEKGFLLLRLSLLACLRTC